MCPADVGDEELLSDQRRRCAPLGRGLPHLGEGVKVGVRATSSTRLLPDAGNY